MQNHLKDEREKSSTEGNKETHLQILKKVGIVSVILSELMGFTLAGVGIGYVAWTQWGLPGWVPLLSSGMGMGLAFYRLYKISQREI